MTKNEYKVGDRVMFKGDGNLHVITDINEEGLYEVSGSCGWFGARYLEPYERKTAFLTRLQSLMREFDAEICYREGDCKLHIDLGMENNRFVRISYMFDYGYDDDEGRLNLDADNIMNFDKE